jgi:hypothetical protein
VARDILSLPRLWLYGGLYGNGCYWFFTLRRRSPFGLTFDLSRLQLVRRRTYGVLENNFFLESRGTPYREISVRDSIRLANRINARLSNIRDVRDTISSLKNDDARPDEIARALHRGLLNCAILQRWKRTGSPPVGRTHALFQARCTRMHGAPLTRERNQRVSSSHCPYRRFPLPLHALSRNTEIADVPFRRRRRERNP